jgi:predicted phosphodiesterase
MRLAVLSDIHGNLEAFKEVLADMDRAQVEGVMCLGDNIGYGPEPEAVVNLVRRRNMPCVMGNHELAAIEPQYLERMNPSPRKSALLTRNLLSAETVAYISTLKPFMIFHGALCVHGCPPDSVTTYLFQVSATRLARLFRAMKERVCFAGHTHDLEIISFDGTQVTQASLPEGRVRLESGRQYIINVGSVGQPRDGNNNAKYVIWDTHEETVDVRFVPYDIAKTVKKILELGFPAFNAERLW